MSMHEKRKRIAAFLLACIAVFGSVVLSGCGSGAPTDQSVDTASVESDNSVTELNDHITLYTNVDASFVKENIGYDGEVSANTANFSRAEQKLVCFPNQGTAAVITGVEAITGYDSGRICYKTTDSAYYEFDLVNNKEEVDSRFVVPEEAVEYKFGFDGILSKYDVKGKTYYCLKAYDTVKYFEGVSEQKGDYFGDSRYNMVTVRELWNDNNNPDDVDCITINLNHLDAPDYNNKVKGAFRVLILSSKYNTAIYYSYGDDIIINDEISLICSYETYITLGYLDEDFTKKFDRDTFANPIFIDTDNKDYQGNPMLVSDFVGDGSNKGNLQSVDIDYCVPISPGVFIIRHKSSSGIFITAGGWPGAIMMGYGINPDGVTVFYSETAGRVIEIKAGGNGGEIKTVYYCEHRGFIPDLPVDSIPWEEYVPEK